MVSLKEISLKFEEMIKDGIRKRVNETAADILDVIRKFQFFFVYILIIWTLWQNAISKQPTS